MTKEEWQNLHNILEGIYNNFRMEFIKMRNGRNQQIRKKAEQNVDNDINLAAHWIRKDQESFELLTGGENVDGFHRAIIWDEFVLPNWFNNDMPEYLDRVQNKINELL